MKNLNLNFAKIQRLPPFADIKPYTIFDLFKFNLFQAMWYFEIDKSELKYGGYAICDLLHANLPILNHLKIDYDTFFANIRNVFYNGMLTEYFIVRLFFQKNSNSVKEKKYLIWRKQILLVQIN